MSTPNRCRALAYTNKPDQLVVQCRLEDGHPGSHIEHQPQHQQENTMETLTDYHRQPAYLNAAPAAQDTIDVVFAAVARVTSPDRAVEVDRDGRLKCLITWHDGAEYQVSINPDGELLRLFRLQYTGAWEWDDIEQRDVPAEEWRTVRAMTKDRAGKVLGPALAGRPAAKSWTEAAAR